MKKVLMIAAASAFLVSGMAATEAVAGASKIKKCQSCHNLDSTAKKVGPGLKGIFGRTMGSVDGFSYGSYLEAKKAEGAVWDEAALTEWIKDSAGVAKHAGLKTKMAKQNVKGDKAAATLADLKEMTK